MLIENRNPIDSILAYMKISPLVLVIYLLTPFIVFATLGIYYLLAKKFKLIKHSISELNEKFGSPGGLGGLFILSFLASVTSNSLVALGEEIGWRGYLLSQLKSFGIIKSALTIGVIWGV